jgi:hypothetical protein
MKQLKKPAEWKREAASLRRGRYRLHHEPLALRVLRWLGWRRMNLLGWDVRLGPHPEVRDLFQASARQRLDLADRAKHGPNPDSW